MIAILIVSLILLFALYMASSLESISEWMKDAQLDDIDDKDLTQYMDNSEYDWGHNIKNYMEE